MNSVKPIRWVVLFIAAAAVVSLVSCPAPGEASEDTGWLLVGAAGFSAGAADYVSLAADSADGTPYVAYVDQSLHSGYPDVQKFAGGTWSSLGDAGDSSVLSPYHYTSLLVAAGVPYLAYSYATDGYTIGTRQYDTGSSVWVDIGSFQYSALTTHEYIALKEYNQSLS